MIANRKTERLRENLATPLVVRQRPGHPTQGLMRFCGVTIRCALGRRGVSSRKREGDGATPRATMRIEHGYVRRDRLAAPQTALALRAIGADDGWCDAPGDANYNRPVRLPFRHSCESMRRNDGLYDICIVLDWNRRPRQRLRGSAIFFHLARPGYLPTEGCIAVSPADMRRLLPHLKRGRRIIVR